MAAARKRSGRAQRAADAGDVTARVAGLDWTGIADALDAQGYALTGPFLTPAECAALIASV